VIAAAGLGSRLGHGLPKCMLEINGTPILSRLIDVIAPHTDRIHVVVGYREELVLDYVAGHHRDVVLVRNPEFRSTNTISSLAKGARGLAGQVLFIDGDTVVRPSSMTEFLGNGAEHPVLVGITPAASDDGVYVTVDESGTTPQVQAFHRDNPTPWEWANTLLAPQEVLAGFSDFVYQALEPRLPLPAAPIELAEVDTEQDLARAREAVGRWEGLRG
jgi:CTP:molybdopterin cytidylyltransferase MocA